MKNRNKKYGVVKTIMTMNIEMDRKKDVVLIKNDVDKMSEEYIRNMIELIEKENQQIKDRYYGLNTPIINTSNRTFVDLVKKFFAKLREKMVLSVDDTVLKNRA